MSHSFPARFPGTCGLCEERIHEGDPIRPTEQGEESSTTFVHADCEAAAPPEPVEHPVCPVCWLTHPAGVCDR